MKLETDLDFLHKGNCWLSSKGKKGKCSALVCKQVLKTVSSLAWHWTTLAISHEFCLFLLYCQQVQNGGNVCC